MAIKTKKAHEGGYRAEHRVRGCMVDVLDNDKVTAVALKVMAAQFGTTPGALRKEGWQVDGPLVIAFDHKSEAFDRERKYAVVCTEGVGWSCDMNGRIHIPLRCGWSGQQDVEIAPKVLLACVAGEQVDLADHVRSFGDRLETNFSLWYERFTA